MATQVVKVRRDTLQACMTCPLCNKLLKEATTISLCLHTFCRKCIYEKLSDDEVDSCPVCDIDLGCLPVEKLRPDHSLQDIRAKIFPYKRRKVIDPEVLPSISPPVKRKERSLSSLVVSTPKVWMQTGLTGKRTKAVARKASALRGCSFSVGDPTKKEEDIGDDHMDSLGADPSNEQRSNEGTKNDVELNGGKVDLWTPLNCLVEAANRTKSSKFNSQGLSLAKLEPSNGPDDEPYMPGAKSRAKAKAESPTALDSDLFVLKTKTKEHGHKTRVQDEKNGKALPPGPAKRRRLRAVGRKRAAEEVYMLDASGAKCSRRTNPIWFSLVASEDQKGDVSLPQISTCYLRIKDGSVPVSFIQKYLVKKLDLTSEAEVEIMCRGQPVLPTLQLHNLVDLWFRTASTSKKVPTSVGSSAKDFVMVLSYCRKVEAP